MSDYDHIPLAHGNNREEKERKEKANTQKRTRRFCQGLKKLIFIIFIFYFIIIVEYMDRLEIRVNVMDGDSIQLSLPLNASVIDLMNVLEAKTGIEKECQVVLYMGHILDRNKLLSDYNIHSGVCIQLVRHQIHNCKYECGYLLRI